MKTDTHTQHTLGPWTAGEERSSLIEPTHRQVTAPHADNGPIRKKIATVYYGETAAEREANARLIAAAPELLAALKLCAEKLALWPEGSNPEFFPSLKAARAAIAKAKGKA